jgi:hypothetical protein
VRWLLALVSVLVAFAAAELGLRGLTAPASLLVLTDPESGYPLEHDPLLGYAPRPGDYGRRTRWRTQVEVTPQRLRSNGAAPPHGAPILAIGDSFTWGDSVNDDETWPAHLERLLGRPVGNGGVSGYGFDQMVLRAERLVAELRPVLVVVSFISDDVQRCENSYRYAPKPFFRIEDGSLVLAGVPVPDARPRDPWRWLRWSRLANRVLGGLLGDRWWLPNTVREHDRGLEVTLLLVERLAALRARPWPRGDTAAGRTAGGARRAPAARRTVEPALGTRTGPDRSRLRGGPRAGDAGPRAAAAAALGAEAQRAVATLRQGGRPGPDHHPGNAWVAEQIAAAVRRAAVPPGAAAR